MDTNIDEHPYQPFGLDGATKLIIGTMPPSRFCIEPKKLYPSDVNFYYGSRDNHFWDIVGEVFDARLTRGTSRAVKERQDLLKKHNIGICDILEKAKRDKRNNASDDNLIVDNGDFLNIKTLLDTYPNITTLIYTSHKVRSLVYQATKQCHCNESKDDAISISLNNKQYKVIILPSPSRRNTLEYSEKIKSYENALKNT